MLLNTLKNKKFKKTKKKHLKTGFIGFLGEFFWVLLGGFFNANLDETGIDPWVYRKPTNSNLILNFNALCPTKWKSGLILCFLNRVKRICSSDS